MIPTYTYTPQQVRQIPEGQSSLSLTDKLLLNKLDELTIASLTLALERRIT